VLNFASTYNSCCRFINRLAPCLVSKQRHADCEDYYEIANTSAPAHSHRDGVKIVLLSYHWPLKSQSRPLMSIFLSSKMILAVTGQLIVGGRGV